MEHPVLEEIVGNLATLTINRPHTKNALTAGTYAALAQHLSRLDADPGIAAIVLTGADGVFTSGNDIGDFLANPPLDLSAPLYDFLRALVNMDTILIAAVEKVAAGIGTTLLLHCDFVIAGQNARFLLPFANLGLAPEAGSSVLLPALIGHRRSMRHLVLGEPIGAEQSRAYGIVTELVDDGMALTRATEIARTICGKPRAAVLQSKRLLSTARDDVLAAIARESTAYAELLQTPETREALAAFLEKRPVRSPPVGNAS